MQPTRQPQRNPRLHAGCNPRPSRSTEVANCIRIKNPNSFCKDTQVRTSSFQIKKLSTLARRRVKRGDTGQRGPVTLLPAQSFPKVMRSSSRRRVKSIQDIPARNTRRRQAMQPTLCSAGECMEGRTGAPVSDYLCLLPCPTMEFHFVSVPDGI